MHKPQPHLLSGPHWRGLRIGLLGGSFNPAHAGHLHVARQALMRLGLDQVWLMVSPQNPLKSTRDMAPLAARMASARQIARHDPRILVTDIETALGTRYTARTLHRLGKRYPASRFVWLMGADNLMGFHRWEAWQHIMDTMPIAVFARLPYSIRAINACAASANRRARLRHSQLVGRHPAPGWAFVPSPLNRLSATQIRQQLAQDGKGA